VERSGGARKWNSERCVQPMDDPRPSSLHAHAMIDAPTRSDAHDRAPSAPSRRWLFGISTGSEQCCSGRRALACRAREGVVAWAFMSLRSGVPSDSGPSRESFTVVVR
jgi:hypothetical protein